MYYSLSLLRSAFFTLLLLGTLARPGMAQIQYAKTVVDSQYTDAPSNSLAVDGDPTTAGKLKPTLLGGVAGGLASSYLRVGFATTIPAGQLTGIIIQPDNPVSGTALNNATITTYKKLAGNQSQFQEAFSFGTLLGVGVGMNNNAPTTITFRPTSGKEFDQVELRISGVNVGSDIDFYEAFTTPSPLPVVLTAFQGKATPAGVTLKWATASERDANYFEVQRTEQLAGDFHALGRIVGAGNSTQAHTYQFVDAAPAGLHYYRLRQVDADGTEKFGPVVTVEAGLLTSLTAYPTLAKETLTVTGPAGTHLAVFNQQGQQVQIADITASQTQQLDVRNLPDGLYFLRDAATGQSTRFIKAGGER